jgi:uncharacterized protein (TIGR00369 family)
MTVAELQRQIDAVPFHEFLKIEAVSVDSAAGEVVLRMPFRHAFRRSSAKAQLHGGVTSAFIDIAGDYALAAILGRGVPTVNLRIDFLRMVENSDLTARARVIKNGRNLGLVDIDVEDGEGKLIAVGRGCYSTRPG